MGGQGHISDEDFGIAVVDGYAAGLTLTQIAAQTGRTRNAVAGKAHRLGISRPAPTGARRASKTPVSKLIRKLHGEGLSTTAIAIEVGLEVSNVRRRLKRQSLPLNASKPATRRSRPTPPETPPAGAGALVYRAGPVDLTPPETATWFADGRGCRFSCWPITERDPMRKRCCGAEATPGSVLRLPRQYRLRADVVEEGRVMGEVVAFDRKPWTAGEDLTVRTMLLAGLSDAAIGQALDRSEASVRTHLCRLGIRRRPPLAERIAIVRMARRGATVRRIAASRRQDETTVAYVLAQAKVTPREFSSYEGPNARRAGR